MQGFSILKKVFDFLLQTGLVKEIYHSVRIIETEKERFPAYPLSAEKYEYVGCNNKKIMVCYLRQIDDLKVNSINQISSTENSYKVTIPHRVVFFNDYEKRDQDELLNKFVQIAFLPGVNLVRAIVDKEKLLDLEMMEGAFAFTDSSFYVAIDFDIKLIIGKNDCETEIGCFNICNPYKK